MNLSQRYNAKSNKRFIRFAFFYAILIIVVLVMNTNSRYVNTTQGTAKAEVAVWNISINNTTITSEQVLTGEIVLVTNSSLNQTTTDNKLAPGKSGYFDVIINPDGTEVAIEYAIHFDLSNLPTDLVLKNYTIIEDGVTDTITNNVITGEILLNANKDALSSSNKKTIRVNWEWEDKTINTIPNKNDTYAIEGTIVVKQKISEGD